MQGGAAGHAGGWQPRPTHAWALISAFMAAIWVPALAGSGCSARAAGLLWAGAFTPRTSGNVGQRWGGDSRKDKAVFQPRLLCHGGGLPRQRVSEGRSRSAPSPCTMHSW